jgi:tetratricopeptide (TPR) repeat protein
VCATHVHDPKDARVFNNRGTAYADSKQFEKAIQDYNQAIELNPKYADVFINRGVAYAKLKQFKKAIQDYNQAIELNPKDTRAFNNLKVRASFGFNSMAWL